ncbi:MAG: hypothetical protein K0U53_10885 [Betaproteobacteria bacterium]|nr:hypothetical protein [Betaproteobacteria bacterium]
MSTGTVKLAEVMALRERYGDRAWAHVLQLRQERGDKLNTNQVRCFRNALNLNIPAQ